MHSSYYTFQCNHCLWTPNWRSKVNSLPFVYAFFSSWFIWCVKLQHTRYVCFYLRNSKSEAIIIFMIFAGERGLEICCNGTRSFIFMVIYNRCGRWNGWHHTTGTHIIRYPCTDWYKNVWNRISNAQTTCHPTNLIIYFAHHVLSSSALSLNHIRTQRQTERETHSYYLSNSYIFTYDKYGKKTTNTSSHRVL